jgi:nucleotide-binding universal stress UspA family protein
MYKKIIVALSLEHGYADRLLQVAGSLADSQCEIIAIHAYEPLQESVRYYVSDSDLAKARSYAESALNERIAGHDNVKAVVVDGHPGRVMVDYAQENGADCIVVGSHKPGLGDYFLGSTAARIVRHAPCSVHVLR